jgi:Flp pilus assembly protein TadG
MRQPPKTLRDDHGQSLVEFALTLPMLLVVMFMITEFGRALYQYNVLAQATREGARVAVVNSEANAPAFGEARMDSFLTAVGIGPDEVDIDVVVESNYAESGTAIVRATAEMPFQWILQGPLPTTANGDPDGAVTPNAFTLHAETVMKAEGF